MIDHFVLPLTVTIRLCSGQDVPGLEWGGILRDHRELFHQAYERHERGEIVMLVAVTQQVPIGQVWIDLVTKRAEGVGILWALRVQPALHGLGLGTRLVGHAETLLMERGFTFSELGVETDNIVAHRLYERLGYHIVTRNVEHWQYTTPDGTVKHESAHEWLMRKRLTSGV